MPGDELTLLVSAKSNKTHPEISVFSLVAGKCTFDVHMIRFESRPNSSIFLHTISFVGHDNENPRLFTMHSLSEASTNIVHTKSKKDFNFANSMAG